jgi:signal transduction histidine kinase
MSRKLNYPYGVIRGYNIKAISHWYSRDPQQAAPIFRELYGMAMNHDNLDLRAMILNNIGVYNMQMGRIDTAEKYLLLAKDIGKQLPDLSRYAKNAADLSMIYLNRGNFLDAITSLLEARNYYSSTNKDYDIVLTNIRLALIYHDIRDFDRASAALKEARRVNKTLANQQLEITINLNTGVLFYEVKNDYDSAMLFLNMAKSMADTTPGQELSALMATVNLGNVANEKKEYRRALDYYLQTVDSPVLLSRNREKTAVYVNLGTVYWRLGQVDQAEKYAKEGVKIAHANKFLKYERSGYVVLARIADQKMDYRLAFRYMQKSDTLRDTLWNEDMKRKVTEAIYDIALKQKESENALLQKENEIKESTIVMQRFFIGGTVVILLLVILLTVVIYRSQRRQRQMNQVLDLKNQQLAESNLTKDKFLSIIAHDLKSPFNALLGFLSELDEQYEKYDEETRRDIIHKLKRSSYNTYNLLENLLSWTQAQRGRIDCIPEDVKVEAVVAEVLSILAGRADVKHQLLSSEIDPELVMRTDPRLLRAILINLVNNSVKFSPENGRISVKATRENKEIRFEVSDTGIGIPDQQIGKLFSIDSQFKRKGTDNEPGTGLGLIMCKEYVSLMGGRISVESKVGEGSRFIFTIPDSRDQAS